MAQSAVNDLVNLKVVPAFQASENNVFGFPGRCWAVMLRAFGPERSDMPGYPPKKPRTLNGERAGRNHSATAYCESGYAAPTELEVGWLLILQICHAYGVGCDSTGFSADFSRTDWYSAVGIFRRLASSCLNGPSTDLAMESFLAMIISGVARLRARHRQVVWRWATGL